MPDVVDILSYGPLWLVLAVSAVLVLFAVAARHEWGVKHAYDGASDELAARQAVRSQHNVVALPVVKEPQS